MKIPSCFNQQSGLSMSSNSNIIEDAIESLAAAIDGNLRKQKGNLAIPLLHPEILESGAPFSASFLWDKRG
jgi:hypothetical protein